MSRNDLDRLFDRMDALTVGFGPMFRNFNYEASSLYPPHNIYQVSDDEFALELAVAGFSRNEIEITEHQGMVTVQGTKPDQSTNEYQYRGIASRNFSKKFRMAEYYEINSATLENGMLTIRFVKNVPESAKPKLIAIG